MIEYRTGSIFSTKKEVITCTVNTVGVMGAGLALTTKYLFPKMFQQYKRFCKAGSFRTGQLWLYKGAVKWPGGVLLFPTKEHWKDPSKIEWIESGLQNLVNTYEQRGIKSLAIPLLGCQNGCLKEEEVLPVMEKYLGLMQIPIEIWRYDPELPNPVWEELYEACSDEDTTFKRLVRDSKSFYHLNKRIQPYNRDEIGKEVNRLVRYEN